MAGDWIKMRSDLFSHPKVVRISSALKADTLRTVGGLMSVWCLFDAHSVDGQLEGYSQQTLDDHVRWPGFSAAMIAVGWLQEGPESLVLPEFETHNGQSAKRRAQDADRKKADRKESASEADKKRTREEKRREDIKHPSGVKRATRKCPADFEITEDMRTWAALECPTVNVDKATAKFLDHTFKTAMTDWAGTWRNWLRKDAEFSVSAKGNQSAESFAERDREAGMQRWEKMTGQIHPDRQIDRPFNATPAAPALETQ